MEGIETESDDMLHRAECSYRGVVTFGFDLTPSIRPGERETAPFLRLRLVGDVGGAVVDELPEDHVREPCG